MNREVLAGWEKAYEKGGQSLWRDEPIEVLKEFMAELASVGGRSVADLGCGDGRNLVAMASAGLLCTGVDISPTGLANAAKRLQAAGASAFLIPANASNLPFADHTLDAITCFDVFGQLPEPEAVIAEASRALIPGGLIALNAFTPGDSEFARGEQVAERSFVFKQTLFRFFEREELIALFAGWDVVRFDLRAWTDPPHGEFRPYEHRHENWFLVARSASS